MKRPPLGCAPAYVRGDMDRPTRIRELTAAVDRYAAASKTVPSSWLAEIQRSPAL
jgi:hypothetical protein